MKQHRFPTRLKAQILREYASGQPPSELARKYVRDLPWVTPKKISDLVSKKGVRQRRVEIETVVARARAASIAEVVDAVRRDLIPELDSMLREEIRQVREDQHHLGAAWENGLVESAGDLSSLMRAKSLRFSRQQEMFGLIGTEAHQPPGNTFNFGFLKLLQPEAKPAEVVDDVAEAKFATVSDSAALVSPNATNGS